MQPYTTRLAEVLATIKANQVEEGADGAPGANRVSGSLRSALSSAPFQHVLIGTRFYRSIFTSGETDLKVGKDAKDLFSKSTGMPPTVGTLDSLANEAIRDVRESIEAYKFLLGKKASWRARHEAAGRSIQHWRIHAGNAHASA